MSRKFKVGELVIMQKASVFEEYDGFLAIVTQGLQFRNAMDSITMEWEWVYCYGVRVLDGDEMSTSGQKFSALPGQLRRLDDIEVSYVNAVNSIGM